MTPAPEEVKPTEVTDESLLDFREANVDVRIGDVWETKLGGFWHEVLTFTADDGVITQVFHNEQLMGSTIFRRGGDFLLLTPGEINRNWFCKLISEARDD